MSEKRGPRPVRTSLIRGLFLLGRAHRRQRVSSGSRRRGTSSACARRTRSARESSNSRTEDTSFARSRDPCSSIVTDARPARPRRKSWKTGRVWRGRFGIAVGQARASGKNRHRDRAIGRSAARRASPLFWKPARATLRRSCVTRQKRKEVQAFVPARKREPRFMAVRREQLQKSAGGTWPRISSHAALQKG
jgi:hypothetical protein